MKLSAQEEYGLRCLLHLARSGEDANLTIPEISRAEGLSEPNVAKLMRLLRMGGLVRSTRGQFGGYALARPAGEITVASVLALLGGPLFGSSLCDRCSGTEEVCVHSLDCSLRPLWSAVQAGVTEVLGKTSLEDLVCSEGEMAERIEKLTGAMAPLRSAAAAGAGARSHT